MPEKHRFPYSKICCASFVWVTAADLGGNGGGGSSRIENGTTAAAGDFPYMAYLRQKNLTHFKTL